MLAAARRSSAGVRISDGGRGLLPPAKPAQ